MSEKSNKLVEILAKAEYAVQMADHTRGQINHPAGLWYHAIGMFNSFYAINEELKIRLKNGDPILKAVVEDWWKANEATVKGFFGNARNTATHQGEIVVKRFTSEEPNHFNDTVELIPRAHISVKDSKIQKMPGEEFLELCKSALTFMRDGILAIDRDYKARGGATHALPEPEDLSTVFSEFDF